MEMIPFVLPVVGLVLVVAQIVYGDVPQNALSSHIVPGGRRGHWRHQLGQR